MDAKITLSFDKGVIEKAKKFADNHNISLSRLTEYLFEKMTTRNYKELDELPVAEWVNLLAEGDTEYHTKKRSRKSLKQEYFRSKK